MAQSTAQLSQNAINLIAKIKRNDVEQAVAELKPFLNQYRWLSTSNPYARDVVGQISIDLKNTNAVTDPKQMTHYIVASAPMHYADGWSYLGRAITALLLGDPHRVIHLAYYAELRAAMSILAAEGIGVFNRKHFVISGPGAVSMLPGNAGTHDMVWLALEEWCNQSISASLFSEIVSPDRRALSDWLQPIGASGTTSLVSKQLLKQWGADLKEYPEDRNTRNGSSYRPDGIPKTMQVNQAEAIDFVVDTWRTLEPTNSSPFNGIDKFLLRRTLEDLFFAVSSKLPKKDLRKFEQYILPCLGHIANPKVKREWTEFLLRKIANTDPKMLELVAEPASDPARGAMAIIGRATLLLRIASGATNRLFASAAFNSKSIGFWRDSFGIGRGLSDSAGSDYSIEDLWPDVGDSLQDIDAFSSATPRIKRSLFELKRQCMRPILTLGSCERVAVWSLLT
jgi:hypothetical protein